MMVLTLVMEKAVSKFDFDVVGACGFDTNEVSSTSFMGGLVLAGMTRIKGREAVVRERVLDVDR